VGGDRRQLVSATYNLLENADKYSPDPSQPIGLCIRGADNRVTFEVADRGSGIRHRPATALTDTLATQDPVARALDAIIAQRGKLLSIVSDNGTELTSMAILGCSQEAQIDWHYIAPGKPNQNAFIESFNDRLRDEPVERDLVTSLAGPLR